MFSRTFFCSQGSQELPYVENSGKPGHIVLFPPRRGGKYANITWNERCVIAWQKRPRVSDNVMIISFSVDIGREKDEVRKFSRKRKRRATFKERMMVNTLEYRPNSSGVGVHRPLDLRFVLTQRGREREKDRFVARIIIIIQLRSLRKMSRCSNQNPKCHS